MATKKDNQENAVSTFVRRNGLTLLEDNAQYKNRFEIKSESSNRLYVVSQNKKTDEWCCSCPGWIIKRGPERTCKHLKTLMPLIREAGL